MCADAVLMVFARAPNPGRAKSRLVPKLGEAGAAHLQARLTELAVGTALAARCGPVELHCSPRVGHAFFLRMRRERKIVLKRQSGRDLGERMHRALAAALRQYRYAVLLGSDAPALCAADLRAALRLLRSGCDTVLAPAEDGGYALIACRRAPAALFEGVAWSSDQVHAQTEARLSRLGLRWRNLRTVWDVDRPADLARLASVPRILAPRAR